MGGGKGEEGAVCVCLCNAGIYSKCIIPREPSFTQLLFMNTPKMTLEVPICLHCISDVNS